jgi:hypothetical protein
VRQLFLRHQPLDCRAASRRQWARSSAGCG